MNVGVLKCRKNTIHTSLIVGINPTNYITTHTLDDTEGQGHANVRRPTTVRYCIN